MNLRVRGAPDRGKAAFMNAVYSDINTLQTRDVNFRSFP